MSGLSLVIINALLYLTASLFFWKKKKKLNVGILLLFVYTIVAIFCIINYSLFSFKYSLTLLPFIYLFIVVLIFMRPFLGDSRISLDQSPADFSFYKLIAIFYIIISIFSCIYYIPIAYDSIINPDWNEAYLQAHEEQKTTWFAKICNLFVHLRYLGIVLLFYFISTKKRGFFTFVLAVLSILPIVLVTISQGSRGGLVTLLFSLCIVYVMFNNYLSNALKRKIKLAGLSLMPLLVIYMVSVTTSRFEDGTSFDSPLASVILYLGHSMLTFDDGIMDCIQRFSYGQFFLGSGDLAKVRDYDSYFGTHFNSAFYTFVGGLYLDFGPYLTAFIGILCGVYFTKLMKKKRLDVPELFLIVTYAMFLLDGVFVVGRGYGFQWIEAVFLFFLLKMLKKINRTHI